MAAKFTSPGSASPVKILVLFAAFCMAASLSGDAQKQFSNYLEVKSETESLSKHRQKRGYYSGSEFESKKSKCYIMNTKIANTTETTLYDQRDKILRLSMGNATKTYLQFNISNPFEKRGHCYEFNSDLLRRFTSSLCDNSSVSCFVSFEEKNSPWLFQTFVKESRPDGYFVCYSTFTVPGIFCALKSGEFHTWQRNIVEIPHTTCGNLKIKWACEQTLRYTFDDEKTRKISSSDSDYCKSCCESLHQMPSPPACVFPLSREATTNHSCDESVGALFQQYRQGKSSDDDDDDDSSDTALIVGIVVVLIILLIALAATLLFLWRRGTLANWLSKPSPTEASRAPKGKDASRYTNGVVAKAPKTDYDNGSNGNAVIYNNKADVRRQESMDSGINSPATFTNDSGTNLAYDYADESDRYASLGDPAPYNRYYKGVGNNVASNPPQDLHQRPPAPIPPRPMVNGPLPYYSTAMPVEPPTSYDQRSVAGYIELEDSNPTVI